MIGADNTGDSITAQHAGERRYLFRRSEAVITCGMTVADPKKSKMAPADIAAGERLRALWNERSRRLGLTQEIAADRLGITQGAVSHYLNKRIPLGLQAALKWAALLGARPGEIRPEFADYEAPSLPSLVVHPVRALPDDVHPDGDHEREIETLEFELSAGNGKLVPTIVETRSPVTYRESWFRRMGYKPDKVKRVRVDGDSMESTLFDGDYVVINTEDSKRVVDGRVYAIIYGADRHGRVKRLYRTAMGLRIVSDNPDKVRFPDELVEGEAADEIVIIGRVVDKSGSGGL